MSLTISILKCVIVQFVYFIEFCLYVVLRMHLERSYYHETRKKRTSYTLPSKKKSTAKIVPWVASLVPSLVDWFFEYFHFSTYKKYLSPIWLWVINSLWSSNKKEVGAKLSHPCNRMFKFMGYWRKVFQVILARKSRYAITKKNTPMALPGTNQTTLTINTSSRRL